MNWTTRCLINGSFGGWVGWNASHMIDNGLPPALIYVAMVAVIVFGAWIMFRSFPD